LLLGSGSRRPSIVFQSYQQNPWLVHLAVKLMREGEDGERARRAFLKPGAAGDPFFGGGGGGGGPGGAAGARPRQVRAVHFRYRYTTPAELAAAAAAAAADPAAKTTAGGGGAANGASGGATDGAVVGAADVWRRERIGEYMPAIGADDPQVMNFLRAHGWN
jgi:hypothetical protein